MVGLVGFTTVASTTPVDPTVTFVNNCGKQVKIEFEPIAGPPTASVVDPDGVARYRLKHGSMVKVEGKEYYVVTAEDNGQEIPLCEE